ncbi:hypothetical protein [Candidatus Poriferisodalis sp.]|uniref:hypothetical protein n=1 Tax=Candidatus Poriferisodalis sp. TaxID=3101277 RepID=UPI003C6FACBC
MDGWHLSDGTAEIRLLLPDTAAEGDVLRLKFTVVDDNHETSEFVSTIELLTKPPRRPGQPDDTPRRPKLRPPEGDTPEIKEVREEQWDQQVPEPSDSSTALRKIDSGATGAPCGDTSGMDLRRAGSAYSVAFG